MSKVLVLKTVSFNYTAYGGFKYPKLGYVKCEDWDPEPICGGGLHGLLWGEGNGRLLNWSEDAIWLVLMVDSEKIIDFGSKVKFPEGEVIYSGNKDEAIVKILAQNPGAACVGAVKSVGNKKTVIVGDFGTATVGHHGKATAGYNGTAIAGHYGTATAGYNGTATAGDGGTATAGEDGKATAGYNGTATAGEYGIATAGEDGKATAGNKGAAIAGYYGTAIAGNYGTSTAGYYGTAQAGENGIINIKYWDKRSRLLVGYVGEGIEANVMYKVENGKFVKV